MQNYYNRRAHEYEAIYATPDPTRRAELAEIEVEIETLVEGKRVLEIACGTGYWTAIAARTALHVTAIDASDEMLDIARAKEYPPGCVTFLHGDAYDLAPVPGVFNAAVANFWFSHIHHARIDDFLVGLQERLQPGSLVFMADNVYIPGVGGELVQPTGSDDTYKLRTLSDGSQHMVLKNYYNEEQLKAIVAPTGTSVQLHMGAAYWWCAYTTP
ncbi:MAG: class I SAM-dependent methyltransferase [Chloroflexia bacterium]